MSSKAALLCQQAAFIVPDQVGCGRLEMMAKGMGIGAGVLVVVAAVGWWLAGRQPLSEAEQISRLIGQAQQAVEHKDARGLIGLLSENYLDPGGNRKQDLARLIISGVRTTEQITVVTTVQQVEVADGRAETVVDVKLGSGTMGAVQVIPLVMQIEWQREGKRWRVVSARGWEEVGESYWNE
jgi:hypothetical protein